MSEMIERVARAIDPFAWSNEHGMDYRRQLSIDSARSAIEAMREPTKEMVSEGYEAIDLGIDYYNYDSGSGYTIEPFAPTETWQAMIDAALKP